MRPRALLMAAGFAASVGALVFACGSTGDGPGADSGPSAEGSVAEGGSDASSTDGARDTGPADSAPDAIGTDASVDAAVDAPVDPPEDAGSAGTLVWAQNFGTTGYMAPHAIAIDPTNGDVVAVGEFNGSVDFGGGLLTNSGPLPESHTTFVARFTKSGVFKWSKALGNGAPSITVANGVAVDAAGNVAVAGVYQGSADLGGGPLTAVGNVDVFLASYDAAGAHRWSKNFGAAGQGQNLTKVAVDGVGNVLIAGIARGGADFGGGPKTGYFIAKFNLLGAHAWSTAFPASSTSSVPMLAVDSAGNAILAGSFRGSVDFGGGAFTTSPPTATDGFVAKFDASGVYQWAKQYGDANGHGGVRSVAADASGNIFLGGFLFEGSLSSAIVNLGCGPHTVVLNKANIILAKVGPTGTCAWDKVFLPDSGQIDGISTDGANNPVVAFSVERTDLGGGPVGGPGVQSLAVASYSSVGTFRWQHAAGLSSTASRGGAAAPQGVAASGTLVALLGSLGGTCASVCATSPAGTTLVFGGQTLNAVSATDLVVATFAR